MAEDVIAQNMRIPIWLPQWMKSYLSYGLAGQTERRARSQFTWNVICLTGGLNSIFLIAVCAFFDISLWPIVVCALFWSVFFLPQPVIYKHCAIMSAWASVTLSMIYFSLLTYLLGLGSGIFIFLLVNPAAGLIILGPSHIWQVCLATALSTTVAICCVLFIEEAALTAARNDTLQTIFVIMSLGLTSALILAACYVAFLNAERAEDALEAEYTRSEALLESLLPHEIAMRLKSSPGEIIAEQIPQVAILFADVVDFTPRAASMEPKDLILFLNRIFSAFDILTEKYGLEKIKTIGDAYMVAAGMPIAHETPVHRIAEMALDMLEGMEVLSEEAGQNIQVRIGLHAGPAIAGVIGSRKPFYDVWGDTVNTASRLESHGEAGRIQVTGQVYHLLKQEYRFQRRGEVEIKGMALVKTWWLVGRKGTGAGNGIEQGKA